MQSNISRLTLFFEDAAYRFSPKVKGLPQALNNMAREDYNYMAIDGGPETRYKVRVAFRADENIAGDMISFHIKPAPPRLQSEKFESAFLPPVKGETKFYGIDVHRLMPPSDFMLFHSLLMVPLDQFDENDRGDLDDITGRIALRLQEEMDMFGLVSVGNSGAHSFDLQTGIMQVYADYRAEIFFERVKRQKTQASFPPPGLK